MSSPEPETQERQDAEWLSQGERGFVWMIKFLFWFATACGRLPARLCVRMVAFWYACFDRAARAGSRSCPRRPTRSTRW